ncbi:MAG TPA: ATP-binding protein [Terriglobales bacterium]|nr:ATP-binding protein [Terriglobales bacterium]
MKLGIAEAQLRLAYINQYRELALGIMLGMGLSARVLGWPVPDPVLVLLGAWFALAWTFVQVSGAAMAEARLQQVEFCYFVLELGLITLLGHYLGVAEWLALLFYVVTILYAHMVLPRRAALALNVLAAASFSGLAALEPLGAIARANLLAGFDRQHPGYVAATLVVGALGGYALIGLTLAQFSLMLNRQAEALQTANRDLNSTGQELRLHRDHLEDLVRQRTSDLLRATDELRRANADLRRLNELKSSFLANVSHELRTPLTSIRSFSEILLHYPDEEVATRSEFLQIIMDESDRLTRLINDVLDLAKIEAGKMEWRLQPLQLVEVARQSLELVQVVAAQKGLRLINRIPEGLPWVSADPDRMRQVFTNLLSNAVKFTSSGSIQVGALARGDEVVAYVSDTGIGIPARDLERIFEKFHQQGNALTDKPAGTGLGLSICREIMQRHGGRIWAESREGEGSIFYCALPALAAQALAAAAAADGGPALSALG